MKEEIKKAYIKKISELLNRPVSDARIQMEYHHDEAPVIRYDITEYIFPEEDTEC